MAASTSNKKLLDPGFGAKYYKPTNRLVNRDGSFNVSRKGVSPFVNAYQFLINLKWGPFLGLVFLMYVVLNTVFALVYYSLDTKHFVGVGEERHFLEVFFFSTQTLTTVGYGAISPNSTWANVISSAESFVGLLFFAMATGLLYGRFSKPNAKIRFSNNLLVSPYKDGRALMFRLVNARSTQLSEMTARMIYSFMEEEGGVYERKYFDLKLERDTVMLFPLSWTLVHKLDDKSPFKEYSLEQLKDKHVELMVLVTGFDDTFNQTVTARYSYTADDIVLKAKFDRIFYSNNKGEVEIEVDKISQHSPAEYE